MKRKRNTGLSADSTSKRIKFQTINPLADVTNKGPGRPWQKRLKRKSFPKASQQSGEGTNA